MITLNADCKFQELEVTYSASCFSMTTLTMFSLYCWPLHLGRISCYSGTSLQDGRNSNKIRFWGKADLAKI